MSWGRDIKGGTARLDGWMDEVREGEREGGRE